jgi:predicted dehydrogenase/aryl-alcohol dehydrogenase-like predicted oxidoreductase
MQKLRWGILSTGSIARRLAKSLQTSQTGVLVAVASRTEEKARAFANEFAVPRAYGSYDELLADPEVDAIYLATPHPDHAKWTIRAARAKKHILCEKPAAMDAAQGVAMLDAVKANGVFFLEAFMYRCHPQTRQLVELIRAGTIGEVRFISCNFGFNASYNASSRLFARHLGGGAILDVGCYAASMARLLAGAALGRDFADPEEVKAVGRLDPGEGTDMVATAVLKFPGGITAQLSTAMQVELANQVQIFGSTGYITVTQPWFSGQNGARILIRRSGSGEIEEIDTSDPVDLYAYELDLVAAHCKEGQAPSPAMTWADTLGNLRTLDAWRAEVGVVYASDRIEEVVRPLWNDTLTPSARVVSGMLPGLQKPMSKLVIGGMAANTVAGQMILDDYFERGGNAFDTAYVYGTADRALGHWMASRGVRNDSVLIAKGAHTPNCTPEGITSQLAKSLEALQTDHADLYIMHRDNPAVPVGEFITVLNEHLRAGRFHAFGCSNWTIERLAEANAYAEQHGLVGFSILNNQLSLARMIDPVWDDCLTVSGPKSRDWLTENQFPLLAWSSQARGFFTSHAHPQKTSNEELVRCWYSDDNFVRKQRANELARERGVEEINIALAYVLAQPFPIWTLIGPAFISEVQSCFSALDIKLTPDELRWLDLEQDDRTLSPDLASFS